MNEQKDLSIALVQSPIHWEDKDKNIAMFEGKLANLESTVDLIILPETFNTGFCMKKAPEYAETMDGPTVKWMKLMAQSKNAVIAGSCMIKENDKFYNRLLWVEPDDKVSFYNKRHLFRLAYEQNYFTEGQERKIVTLHGWKICLNICYDLRFPVWCRNRDDYDILLFVANWPVPRILHWTQLLSARAIENLSYVVGVNRLGTDGTGMEHNGNSAVIQPDGLVVTTSEKEEILYATLSYKTLTSVRNRFQFLRDKDTFEIK